MVYREAICPHCGNEVTVKNVKEGQKCKWCRRLIKAIFKRKKNGKWMLEVEPIYFESNQSDSIWNHNKNLREGHRNVRYDGRNSQTSK